MCSASNGWFDEELVVAKEGHDFAVAIDPILAKHGLGGYDSSVADLIEHEVELVLVRRHFSVAVSADRRKDVAKHRLERECDEIGRYGERHQGIVGKTERFAHVASVRCDHVQ